jgi:hypothetical protein
MTAQGAALACCFSSPRAIVSSIVVSEHFNCDQMHAARRRDAGARNVRERRNPGPTYLGAMEALPSPLSSMSSANRIGAALALSSSEADTHP